MTRTRLWGGCVLLVILVMLTHTVHAQAPDAAPSSSYLPLVRKSPPPATFALRVARVDRNRSAAACLNPLAPETVSAASPVQICPVEGDYIALVASNPGGVAIGGKDGEGDDAAWSGSVADYDLIPPTQTIADADIVEIRVPGYLDDPGLFTAPSDDYSVIVLPQAEDTVGAASMSAIPVDQVDFQQTLYTLIHEGQTFDVVWPSGQEFWDKAGLVRFRPSSCGVTQAIWVPDAFGGVLLTDRVPAWVLHGGTFEPPALAQCMGVYRYVRVGDLMTHPAAENLRNRVNARRGGSTVTFEWFTDATGAVYTVYTIATGSLAYYGYRVLNSATPSPAMFLYIPNALLDVTCATVQGVKTCLVEEGEPQAR